MGSGRTGGNPTDEATGSFILSVKGLLGRFPWSAVGSGTITFRSRWHGEFPVEVRVSTTDRAAPHVELTHATRDGTTGRITYRVGLTTTRPRYDSERWWFVCPEFAVCGQRLEITLALQRVAGTVPGAC